MLFVCTADPELAVRAAGGGKKLVFTDSSVQAPHLRHNTEAHVANTNTGETLLFLLLTILHK